MEEDIKNMSKEELLEYLEDISQQLDNIALDQIQFAISELQFFKEEYKKLEEENKRLKAFEDFKLKNDYIPTSVIQNKIEEINNSNGYSPVNKIFIEKVLNEILEERRR